MVGTGIEFAKNNQWDKQTAAVLDEAMSEAGRTAKMGAQMLVSNKWLILTPIVGDVRACARAGPFP